MKTRSFNLKIFRVILTLMVVLSISQIFAYTEKELIRNDQLSQQAFGFSVDIYANTALAGAYGSANGFSSFFTFNGTDWVLQQKVEFTPDYEVMDVGFGYKVIIDGDRAMISAPWDWTGETLNGAVYYYTFNGTAWVMQQKIIGSIQGGYDDFGIDMALDGDVLVVGASGTDLTPWTSVPTEMNYGVAYVFKFNGTQWVQEQILTASDGHCFDDFGCRVDIKDNTIVVTAPDAGNFNPSDIHSYGPGQAYVYHYNGESWVETQILAPANGTNNDWYGRSVKITDDYLFIGSLKENTTSTARGALYCYENQDGQWAFSQKIIPINNDNVNYYGSAIDSDGEKLFVGCGYWLNSNNGAVYSYNLNEGNWQLDEVITHSDPTEFGDDLGTSLAYHQGRLIAGAPWADGWAGKAFVFHLSDMAPVADAGEDQTVEGGVLVTLDGSGSYDPEGSALTYLWTSPTGISLSSNTVVNPNFTAPVTQDAFIELEFTLVVNDGNSDSEPSSVIITVLNTNHMPIADAGVDQIILSTTNCILDGSASYDPEGSAITYLWTAPQGITLSNATIATPVFTSPLVEEETIFTFTLVVNDGEFNSLPSSVDITVKPALPVTYLEYDSPSYTFKWQTPDTVEKTFRYDDGFLIDALGANNPDAMLGSAFYENSIIDQVSWYLTNVSVTHTTVNIVIMGLTASGAPDQNNILYQQMDVPNIDMQWNHHTLANPIEAANGFYIGLNYAGFLSLGMDDGIGEPYEFIPGTQWVSFDWTNGEWGTLEDAGFENSFLVRAHGISLGALERGDNVANSSVKLDSAELIRMPLSKAIDTRESDRNEFFINEYNVYIDGVLVLEGLTERTYTVGGLTNGAHMFAVTAVYDNFIESAPVEMEFEYDGSDNSDITQLEKAFLKNYPNPFNPSTTISFNLKKDSMVNLVIYNIKGQRVAQLANGSLKSGIHNVQWNGKSDSGTTVGSGIYFYQLETNYDKRIGKMMLMK